VTRIILACDWPAIVAAGLSVCLVGYFAAASVGFTHATGRPAPAEPLPYCIQTSIGVDDDGGIVVSHYFDICRNDEDKRRPA
jgi:hypothetical protein